MYANLILGFRDIWKHKLFFGACIVFLITFCVVVAIVVIEIGSVARASKILNESKVRVETFEPIYTQYDFSYDRKNLESISGVYDKNAVSHRPSQSLTRLYGRPVYLVFGDGSLINPGIVNQEGITAYAYNTNDLDYIEILGTKHQIELISRAERFQDEYTDYDPFSSRNSIFVVYQGEAMTEIIHYMAENNPNVFYDIVENTLILVEDSKRIDDFTNYVNKDVEGIAFKGNFYKVSRVWTNFLIFYWLPLTTVLSIIGTLSFLLIFQGMIQRMKRDLTIHLQSGARYRDVLMRFYVFYGSIIGITLVSLIIRFLKFRDFLLLLVFCTSLFVIIVSIYIARALKRTNLFENLRGDMV